MAVVGLTSFVNQAFVVEVSSIIHPTIVRVSWIAYPYFEGPVLFFRNVPILLVVDIFLSILLIITTLGDSVLGRIIPFFRSSVDDRYVGRDVTNVHYLDFLIGIFFNKMTLLSTL